MKNGRWKAVALCAAALAGATALAQGTQAAAEIPLPEHPRPDWERTQWLNLNGKWHFAFDREDGGLSQKWQEAGDAVFSREILVPFPWGSELSGTTDEADIGWYRRDIEVPAEWKGKRVFLVIGASDHDTSAWIDGRRLGEHSGGYTPFEFELTGQVKWGKKQKLTLRVWDLASEAARKKDRSGGDWRLFGKQGYGNARGVWQTVYLEARGMEYLETVHFTPDIDRGLATAEVRLGAPAKLPLSLEIAFAAGDREGPVTAKILPGQMKATLDIPLPKARLWTLDDPYLYEVECRLSPTTPNGPAPDAVKTYFGMRKVGVGKTPTGHPYVTLNGKPVYLQLTLDQSYHPKGFYTFPSDDFMRREIELSKELGLTGNRIHIKVEVPRKLYWADRLGLLIMADVPNAWGPASEAMFREHRFCMEDMIRRDYNHPCIFSWVLFNETWGLFDDGRQFPRDKTERYAPWVRREVARAYERAKALDPTRLVEDNSPCNNDHIVTDINTWHTYLPGYNWEGCVEGWCRKTFPGSKSNFIGGFQQGGQPMFNSECGNVWGYKGSTGDIDWSWDYHWMLNAFRRRMKCAGWLYTEHHDVINEWNGYVRYDRTAKFTGIPELTGGRMTLRDLHADAYLPLDPAFARRFEAGAVWKMPVGISLATDCYAGMRFTLASRLIYLDATGREHDEERPAAGPFTLFSWQNGLLAEVPVALPGEAAAGVAYFALLPEGETDDAKAIARNFACFATDAAKRGAGAALVASAAPGAYAKSSWSRKEWKVLGGLKVCGAGAGFFEYVFDVPEGARTAVFRAEVSSKRLNAKDLDGAKAATGAEDLDCMLGGGHYDRSKNKNSYPMTSEDRWPGAVKVYVNGTLVKTQALPDDPADHRGILSWLSQPRDKTLHEAGSYGCPVAAEIPEEVLIKGKGKATVRLEADAAGLAIYGERFGRIPCDPCLEFKR